MVCLQSISVLLSAIAEQHSDCRTYSHQLLKHWNAVLFYDQSQFSFVSATLCPYLYCRWFPLTEWICNNMFLSLLQRCNAGWCSSGLWEKKREKLMLHRYCVPYLWSHDILCIVQSASDPIKPPWSCSHLIIHFHFCKIFFFLCLVQPSSWESGSLVWAYHKDCADMWGFLGFFCERP